MSSFRLPFSDTSPKNISEIQTIKFSVSVFILIQKCNICLPYQCLLVLLEKNMEATEQEITPQSLLFFFSWKGPSLLSPALKSRCEKLKPKERKVLCEGWRIDWRLLTHPTCPTVDFTYATKPYFCPGHVDTSVLYKAAHLFPGALPIPGLLANYFNLL